MTTFARIDTHLPLLTTASAARGSKKDGAEADSTTGKLIMVAVAFFALIVAFKLGLHKIILAPFIALFAVIGACFCKAHDTGNHDVPGSGHASTPSSSTPSASSWSWTSSLSMPTLGSGTRAAVPGGSASAVFSTPTRPTSSGAPFLSPASPPRDHDAPGSALGRNSRV